MRRDVQEIPDADAGQWIECGAQDIKGAVGDDMADGTQQFAGLAAVLMVGVQGVQPYGAQQCKQRQPAEPGPVPQTRQHAVVGSPVSTADG